MIDITFSLKHMAWANEKLFTELAGLPVECLQATYGPADWTVAHIAAHIASGDEWYLHLLTGADESPVSHPQNSQDVIELRDYMKGFLHKYLEEAAKPDAEIIFDGHSKNEKTSREMLLHQAVYHATEHRAHIATAIEVQGIAKIDLDSYDVWSYFYSNL